MLDGEMAADKKSQSKGILGQDDNKPLELKAEVVKINVDGHNFTLDVNGTASNRIGGPSMLRTGFGQV
jgi:hypothetical protein